MLSRVWCVAGADRPVPGGLSVLGVRHAAGPLLLPRLDLFQVLLPCLLDLAPLVRRVPLAQAADAQLAHQRRRRPLAGAGRRERAAAGAAAPACHSHAGGAARRPARQPSPAQPAAGRRSPGAPALTDHRPRERASETVTD